MALYVDMVLADGPSHYWRLNDTPGSPTAANLVGGATGTVSAGVSLGAPAAFESSGTSAFFNGTTGKIVTTPITVPAACTFEAWVSRVRRWRQTDPRPEYLAADLPSRRRWSGAPIRHCVSDDQLCDKLERGAGHGLAPRRRCHGRHDGGLLYRRCR